MKKAIIFTALALLSLGVGFYLYTNVTKAGGPSSTNARLTLSSASATADGQSAVTVTIFTYMYKCSISNEYGEQYSTSASYCAEHGFGTASEYPDPTSGTISVSGSGNIVSATSFTTNASGYASFTLKSTVAETKTIQLASTLTINYSPVSVSFVNPVAAAPKRTTAPTPVTPTPAPTETPAPTAPSLVTITNDTEKTDPAKPITLEQSKPLVLSGTTVANGVVTLTIHSTPKTVKVTADKDGRWSYTVTGLETGSHYVEAAVTDPATNKTSATAKLVSFTVTAPAKKAASTTTANLKSTSPLGLILSIAGGILVAGVVAGGIWYWRKKKGAKNDQNNTPTPPTAEENHQ